MKKLFFTLILPLLLLSEGAKAQTCEEFPYPTIPSYLSPDGWMAIEWYVLNFWNDYDFAAFESRYSAETNRQAFVEFVNTLYLLSPECSSRAIKKMMARAAASEEGYWYFLEKAEDVLYDPQSPMRNDLLWEQFVRHALSEASPIDSTSKERYRSLLALVSRNQQGTIATDFAYTLADGTQGQLHKIKAPFTVIYFYNPGCSECARTRAQIEATGYLEALHQRGLVEVLALHPDEDVAEWRRHLAEMPEWWINAYDKGQTINRKGLYDLKAIPTLYLLDSEKRVMMKDPTVEDFLAMLERLLN